MRQLVELQELKDELAEHGATVVALSVDPLEAVTLLKRELGLEYPVLSDADTAVSREYRVYNLLGDRLAAPSMFILDEDGIVRWRYIGRDLADRPTPEQILKALEDL